MEIVHSVISTIAFNMPIIATAVAPFAAVIAANKIKPLFASRAAKEKRLADIQEFTREYVKTFAEELGLKTPEEKLAYQAKIEKKLKRNFKYYNLKHNVKYNPGNFDPRTGRIDLAPNLPNERSVIYHELFHALQNEIRPLRTPRIPSDKYAAIYRLKEGTAEYVAQRMTSPSEYYQTETADISLLAKFLGTQSILEGNTENFKILDQKCQAEAGKSIKSACHEFETMPRPTATHMKIIDKLCNVQNVESALANNDKKQLESIRSALTNIGHEMGFTRSPDFNSRFDQIRSAVWQVNETLELGIFAPKTPEIPETPCLHDALDQIRSTPSPETPAPSIKPPTTPPINPPR